jgi:hypothetical protein
VDEAYDDDQGDARSDKPLRTGSASDRQCTHFPHPLSVDSTLMTLSISTTLLSRCYGEREVIRVI